MNKKIPLKKLCIDDEWGKYGIPASAEEYDSTQTRYLRITDISEDGELLNNDKKSVTAPDIDKYILQEGDIVFARTGNSTGKAYYHEAKNGKLAFAGFLIRYSLDKAKVNPKYLKFFTITNEYKNWVKNLSVGSTRGNINAQTFGDCPISLPERSQQDFLVSILSVIIKKIELNKRINAELEAMAKTLYDYWFVQFDFPASAVYAASAGKPELAGKPYKTSGGKMVWSEELKREIPEGWEVKRIGDFGEFKNGINYDPSIEGDIDAKIINVRNISSSNLFISQYELDTITLQKTNVNNYLVTDKDILIARSGIPGATRMIFEFAKNTIYCGFIIRFQVKVLANKNYLFYFLKDMEKNTTSKSGGTIMPNVNQDTLKRMQIIEPKKELISKFNEFVNPLFMKMNGIIHENQKLAELRDWLLPMLMNGQVKVKEEMGTELAMAAEPKGKYKKG